MTQQSENQIPILDSPNAESGGARETLASERLILHVDMDAFFVSVERRADPSLAGKPVIVGGDPDGRGVVCSASYEARVFGVRSAMPMAHARRLCPQAICVPVGRSDYGAAAQEVRELWRAMTPLVESMSLDEAYLDLTGTERLHGLVWLAADALIRRTREKLKLPCSIGIAVNKMLAKVASDYVKPQGLLRIMAGEGGAFLRPLPLRRMPGIGPKTEERLARYGLETLGDLVDLGKNTLEAAMGEMGVWLWLRAGGYDDSPVRAEHEQARSISRETTFETDTTDPRRLDTTLSWLSERVAAALREEGLAARTVTLKLRYSDFETLTRSSTLAGPTNDDRAIYEEAARLLAKAHTRRVCIRLLGVGTSNLCESQYQLDLFDAERQIRRGRLNAAFDAIRARYGKSAVLRARSWPMDK
ncbi:MAG: DNA polymerase IV [Candidatus Sumerlaeota bacterium]|nr:DNA polymerase IV [Candidatus Sumerlaeota bacterium]